MRKEKSEQRTCQRGKQDEKEKKQGIQKNSGGVDRGLTGGTEPRFCIGGRGRCIADDGTVDNGDTENNGNGTEQGGDTENNGGADNQPSKDNENNGDQQEDGDEQDKCVCDTKCASRFNVQSFLKMICVDYHLWRIVYIH